jgi:hypothetical protein
MIIYKTTNLINGISYIGRDINNDASYLGSGSILKKAIKKYGKENFKKEIIEICISLDELKIREEYWIKKYDAAKSDKFYNILESSTGGDTLSNHPYIDEIKKRISIGTSLAQIGRIHTDETKLKIKNSNIGLKRNPISDECKEKISKKLKEFYKNNKHHLLGKTKETDTSVKSASEKKKNQIPWNKNKLNAYSPETIKKMSDSAKNRSETSTETRNKISESLKGRVCSEDTRKKISIGNKGKYVTDETKKKLRDAHLGKKISEEQKLKISNSLKNKNKL